MTLFSRALGILGLSGLQLAAIAAGGLALYGAGYATGRVQEAHGAVATVVKQQPAQTAVVTKAANEKIQAGNAEVKKQQAVQDAADRASHDLLQGRIRKLESDLRRVRGQLNEVKSDACLSDDNVIGGGSLRVLLDQATGATPAGIRGDGAAAAPHSDGAYEFFAAAAAAPPVTCGQIKAGYTNLAEWGRKGWATVEAFQVQARKLNLVAEGDVP